MRLLNFSTRCVLIIIFFLYLNVRNEKPGILLGDKQGSAEMGRQEERNPGGSCQYHRGRKLGNKVLKLINYS